MSLLVLQERISRAATEKLLPILLEQSAKAHTANWRECDCSWCKLKQVATARIAGIRHGDKEQRADIRFHLANEFRQRLRLEFEK